MSSLAVDDAAEVLVELKLRGDFSDVLGVMKPGSWRGISISMTTRAPPPPRMEGTA